MLNTASSSKKALYDRQTKLKRYVQYCYKTVTKAVTVIRAIVFQEDIAKLLLFESSSQRPDVKVTLPDYCSRMQAGQREIYYLYAPR